MALAALGFNHPGYQAYAASAQGNYSGLASAGVTGQMAGASLGIEGEGKVGAAQGADRDDKVKPGHKSSPAECQTCKERKYKDGSNENVSYKAATHISPEAAGAAVRGHEGEHVANAYSRAAEKGGRVLRASVSIHTAICPECGRSYVSGGTTSTAIAYPKDDGVKTSVRNPKEQENFDT